MSRIILLSILAAVGALFSSCSDMETTKVYVTSEAGDKFAEKENISFDKARAAGFVVSVDLENERQVIDGIGSSLTESSAFVLASIPVVKRKEVLEKLYGQSGANFPITRTHIGSCDFTVEGKYSYVEKDGDVELETFSLQPDMEGFPAEKYPLVQDPSYDLLPLIKEVKSIKDAQGEELRIMASPWTAPAWMKDTKEYYGNGTGGHLTKENYPVFANYFVKYFQAMKDEGIDIWSITPVNEPYGNSGSWESMHFSPEEEAVFVGDYLGPAIEASEFSDVQIFGFDQNRPEMMEWADALYGHESSAKYTDGLAIHWYASTYLVYEEILSAVHEKYPDYSIIHSEGCIDNLGVEAGDWARDPEGWTEEGWFNDDSWWWEKNASDWGYEVPWGDEFHPLYAPTHRYARNIIVSINNWMTGFIDWNVVLDAQGGPNHVGNFCGAPVMIDIENQDIYFTPVYDILSHFSKTIRPGDIALKATPQSDEHKDELYVGAVKNDKGEVVVSMLNVTQEPITFNLQLGDYTAVVTAPANALQTLVAPVLAE